MNFVIEPRLEHFALIKVSAELWNQPDIRDSLKNTRLFSETEKNFTDFHTLPFAERERDWQQIEHRVMKKVSQLMIPSTLKSKLFRYIPPIGLQILKWMEYHTCCINFLPDEFYWTPKGTIDKKKTAELLVKYSNTPIMPRFILACLYCLKNDIVELWNKLSEREKIALSNELDYCKYLCLDSISHSEVILFWWYYVQGRMAELRKLIKRKLQTGVSSSDFALTASVNSANVSAIEYFFYRKHPTRKLLHGMTLYAAYLCHRSNRVVNHAPDEYYSEALMFLLSQMNSEEQERIFKRYSSVVLMCCLYWPWQNFFLKTANHMLNFMPEHSYYSILVLILHRIQLGCKDYNYQKLFQDFWQLMPLASKSYVMNDKSIINLIEILFHTEDKKSMKLLFNHLNFTEKNKFIFDNRGLMICRLAKDSDKWDMLKLFIQLCISSKDEMIQLRRKIRQVTLIRYYVWKEDRIQNNWNKFLKLFDDCVREYNKRDNVNGESSSAKRLCTSARLIHKYGENNSAM